MYKDIRLKTIENIDNPINIMFVRNDFTIDENENVNDVETPLIGEAELHKCESHIQSFPVPNRFGISWHPSSIFSLSVIKAAISELKHPRIVSEPPKSK